MTAGPAAGWVGETDARPQTDSPTLDELSFPAMELYAMPAATATLLEDSAVNIDEWIAQRGRAGLRRAGGHGLRQRRRHQQAEGLPRTTTTVAERLLGLGQDRLHRDRRRRRLPGERPVRCAGRSRLCAEGRLPAERHLRDEPQDAGAIRKFKDADGNYLWQPPAQAGGRAQR